MVGVENSGVGKVTDWEVAVIIVIMWFLLLVPRVRVLSIEIEKERRQGFVQDTNMTNSYYFSNSVVVLPKFELLIRSPRC
jgi:hypothetical protein